MSATLFTQFKQWIELFTSDQKAKNDTTGAGSAAKTQTAGEDTKANLGAYFERISGGQATYSLAEAALANSRGMVYRSTRFRISEINLENTLDNDTYQAFCTKFESFRKNGSEKFTVRRTLKDGNGSSLVYLYKNCSVSQPPGIDDGDVGQDSSFLTMRIGLQPEGLVVYDGTGKPIMSFDPDDALDGQGYAQGTNANKE